MNWRPGLFRAWIVASICWVAFIAWRSDLACPLHLIGLTSAGGPWCEFQNAEPLKYYSRLAVEMIVAPLLAGVALLAIIWVVDGFRRRPR